MFDEVRKKNLVFGHFTKVSWNLLRVNISEKNNFILFFWEVIWFTSIETLCIKIKWHISGFRFEFFHKQLQINIFTLLKIHLISRFDVLILTYNCACMFLYTFDVASLKDRIVKRNRDFRYWHKLICQILSKVVCIKCIALH